VVGAAAHRVLLGHCHCLQLLQVLRLLLLHLEVAAALLVPLVARRDVVLQGRLLRDGLGVVRTKQLLAFLILFLGGQHAVQVVTHA
jgi:hypothetical protein